MCEMNQIHQTPLRQTDAQPNFLFVRSIDKRLLGLFIFLSGAAALIYELVWARVLHLVFGVSTFAIATVTAVFMLGLALGSYLFGRVTERVKDRLTIYAYVELGIGILSLFSFLLLRQFHLFGKVYYSLYNTESFFLLTLGRLLIAAFILLPPTILMGGTIPLVTGFLVRKEGSLGADFSRIYYLNTIGALLGTLATGLWLIRFTGVAASFLVAVILNLLIAVGIFSLATKKKQTILDQERKNAAAAMPSMLAILFVTGLVSLGFEVLFIRTQSVYTLSTTYSFTAILAGFLAGIGLGSGLTSLWIDKTKRQNEIFFTLLVMMGLFGQAVILAFSKSFPENITGQLAVGFLASLLFAFIPGVIFPIGLRMYAGSIEKIGLKTGRIYLANTLGAVTGSLLTGFVLIPVIGIRYGSLVLSLLLFSAAGYYLKESPKYRFFFVTALVLAAVCFALTPNRFFVTPGPDSKVIFYEEGLAGTVTVTEEERQSGTFREMAVDGNGVSSNNPKMIIDAKLLAHIPLLLHPDPKTVATIGYGTGGTSYSMLLHGTHTYGLEIEAQVVEGSKLFPYMSGGVLNHPQFHLVIDDARSYLQATEQQFDVIVTDCTNLKYKSNPLLYTTDYFQVMKNRLVPGGISAAWVPLSGLSFNDLRVLIASFHKVYPHMTIWLYSRSLTHFVIFVGTEKPLQVDLPSIGERMAREGVREDLQEIAITNELLFGSMLFLNEDHINALVKGVPLHTDNHPILEFSDIQQYMKPSIMNNLEKLLAYQSETLPDAFPEQYRTSLRGLLMERKQNLLKAIERNKDIPYFTD